MNRRDFLKLLGVLPIVPLALKVPAEGEQVVSDALRTYGDRRMTDVLMNEPQWVPRGAGYPTIRALLENADRYYE